ncbi:MAG: TIR domain-containing protein [Myxococcota bacterium]
MADSIDVSGQAQLLFVSHSSADTTEARELAHRLRQRGVNVWIDVDDLRLGEPWQTQIEDALTRSSALLVYVGSSGIKNWVHMEVQWALQRAVKEQGYRFIPVLSPSARSFTALPPFVQLYQGVRVEADSTEWLEKLTEAACGAAPKQKPEPIEEPFVGLRAIDESSSHLFFGREEETQKLVRKVAEQTFVLVVGDSASGKSSLVRAGLIPQFRGGALATLRDERPNQRNWHVIVMRPGDNPLAELANSVDSAARPLGLSFEGRHALRNCVVSAVLLQLENALFCDLDREHTEVLLVVDQFEELWTQCSEADRKVFVSLLLSLSGAYRTRVRVVASMRRDYVNLCSEIHELHQRLEASQRMARFELGAIQRDALARVVTGPLELAGETSQTANRLAELVQRDVGERAGELALVQMALTEAWKARRDYGDSLLDAYAGVGRVEGALARAADSVYAKREAASRVQMDAVFIRLVRLGDIAGATRRLAARSEFDPASWRDVEFLASEEGKRLVLLGGDDRAVSVEISHEALVTTWPHLQSLLREQAAPKRIFDQLTDKARSWSNADDKLKPELLAAGAELASYERLLRERSNWLSQSERAFVENSRRNARAAARLKRSSVVAICILSIVAAGFGVKARYEQERAEHEAAHALAERGRQLWVEGYASRAAVYLGEAYRLDPENLLARSLLPRTLESVERLELTLHGSVGPLFGGWLSPDNRRAAGFGVNGVEIWNIESGTRLTQTGCNNRLMTAAFSPGGEHAVLACYEERPLLLETGTGRVIAKLADDAGLANRFTPDGARLITGSANGNVKLWDARSGALLRSFTGHKSAILAVACNAPCDRLVTADSQGTARVWDLNRDEQLVIQAHASAIRNVGFSPDGRQFVTASDDGTAKLWDAQTGGPALILAGHAGWLRSAMFSPDGAKIVTAAHDRTVRIWSTTDAAKPTVLSGHLDDVKNATFSGDGQRIISASEDGTARVWDVLTGVSLMTLDAHVGALSFASLSADGQRALTAGSDGTLRLWRTAVSPARALETPASWIHTAMFSYDGRRLLTSGDVAELWDVELGKLVRRFGEAGSAGLGYLDPTGTRILTTDHGSEATLWDADNAQRVASLRGHTERVLSASFSRDGKKLVTVGEDRRAYLWDGRSGAPLAKLEGHTDTVMHAALNETGTRAATASEDKTAKVWDTRSGQLLATLAGHSGGIVDVAFSPDGDRVLTAGRDKTARLWEQTGRALATLAGHLDQLTSASFSADGSRIVTTSRDKTARLWDARTGTLVAVLEGHFEMVGGAQFSGDGSRVVTAAYSVGTRDRTATIWDARTGRPILTIASGLGGIREAHLDYDGSHLVLTSQWSKRAEVWDVHLEQRPPAQIAALLAERDAWRLEAGALVPDPSKLAQRTRTKARRAASTARAPRLPE